MTKYLVNIKLVKPVKPNGFTSKTLFGTDLKRLNQIKNRIQMV